MNIKSDMFSKLTKSFKKVSKYTIVNEKTIETYINMGCFIE